MYSFYYYFSASINLVSLMVRTRKLMKSVLDIWKCIISIIIVVIIFELFFIFHSQHCVRFMVKTTK